MKSFKWFSIGKSSGSLEYDPVACTPEYQGKKGGERGAGPLSLQELTARAVVATRRNFYSIRPLAPRLKEYLTQIVKNIEVMTKFWIYWEKSDILNFFFCWWTEDFTIPLSSLTKESSWQKYRIIRFCHSRWQPKYN